MYALRGDVRPQRLRLMLLHKDGTFYSDVNFTCVRENMMEGGLQREDGGRGAIVVFTVAVMPCQKWIRRKAAESSAVCSSSAHCRGTGTTTCSLRRRSEVKIGRKSRCSEWSLTCERHTKHESHDGLKATAFHN